MTEHKMYSLDAQWLRIPMEVTEDGIDYEEITVSEAQEGMVFGTEDEWKFECNCGAEFSDYDKAEEHIVEND